MKIKTGHYITILGMLLALFTTFLVFVVAPHAPPNFRAVFYMGGMLVYGWCFGFGAFSRLMRDRVRAYVLAIPLEWKLKFVLFTTLLALLEEVVTVTATNMAPVFGVPVGAAYVTASANYFDVVLLHSVVVFVPGYIVWAWLLGKYDFSPNAVFLLYGLSGTLAEMTFGGFQHYTEYPMWTFVYGLMMYLPAYCLPADRGARKPGLGAYLLTQIIPGVAAGPVAAIIMHFHPVKIHFPPIKA